ncbi:MAG: glycosyltransferase [Deltaproteobacteria bacterium]|nr:MAG: glycosyltransferase [Deltaproteobacteria bacterium]
MTAVRIRVILVAGSVMFLEIVFYITCAVCAAWCLLFVQAVRRWRLTPRIRPARRASHEPLPRVSVVIPARNEEQNIIPCLESLLEQDHTDIEVIVCDDGSTDATAAMVARLARADYRVRLVRAGPLPEGWTGKCHAIDQAIRRGRPTGRWLLFTDADTRHGPQSISAPLQVALDRGLDMVTLVPHLEAKTFWEKIMQPTVAAWLSLLYRPERVNDPSNPLPFANGQYILVRREAYEEVGGHRAVCSKVLEDTELARLLVARGKRMLLALGRRLFSVRMYSSMRELVEGWAKNIYLLFSSRLTKVFSASLAAFFLSMWPVVAAAAGLWEIAAEESPALLKAAVCVGAYFLVLSFQVILRALNRWYPAYAFFAPLSNLIAVYLFYRSMLLHRLRGKVTWKGRSLTNR